MYHYQSWLQVSIHALTTHLKKVERYADLVRSAQLACLRVSNKQVSDPTIAHVDDMAYAVPQHEEEYTVSSESSGMARPMFLFLLYTKDIWVQQMNMRQ